MGPDEPEDHPKAGGLRAVARNKWVKRLFCVGALLLALNEIRGLVLAVPVLYALWYSGGTLVAIWVAFSALAGIALSVAVPWWIARWLSKVSFTDR